jgi:hypothetical protein
MVKKKAGKIHIQNVIKRKLYDSDHKKSIMLQEDGLQRFGRTKIREVISRLEYILRVGTFGGYEKSTKSD